MILHTLNKTQSDVSLNKALTNACSGEDSVLLLEDAVYQLLAPDLLSSENHWSCIAKTIYVLAEDARARGIVKHEINSALTNISFVSYEGFVALAASHNKTISWY